MNTLEKYIGKVIVSYTFSNELFRLVFESEVLELYPVGECCSQSWFESISGEEALSGKLLEIRLVELSELTKEEYDVTKFYGVKIKTDKGYVDIDMRNSSNGFYGGNIGINSADKYSCDSISPEYN